MKQYLKLETCKRLVELGCTSQSKCYYDCLQSVEWWNNSCNAEGGRFSVGRDCTREEHVDAFEFEDIAGPSEHAYRNRVIVAIGMRDLYTGTNWAIIIEAALGEDPE